jgi:hypothetical protein
LLSPGCTPKGIILSRAPVKARAKDNPEGPCSCGAKRTASLVKSIRTRVVSAAKTTGGPHCPRLGIKPKEEGELSGKGEARPVFASPNDANRLNIRIDARSRGRDFEGSMGAYPFHPGDDRCDQLANAVNAPVPDRKWDSAY